ncbi:MAG: carbohydrate porin [Verrucomicrobiae bacterium]|nr:carbohydrate porin [Verrucomicrobiae bacterium]
MAGWGAEAGDPAPLRPSGPSEHPGELLQYDSLGRLVATPTNAIPPPLLPPHSMGIQSQIPNPPRGLGHADATIRRRIDEVPRVGWEWFPAAPPPLMPYLAGNDRLGNTSLRPGSLFEVTPWEGAIQGAKYAASTFGLNYSLAQTLSVVGMGSPLQGDRWLGAYGLDFFAKWTVFSSHGGAAAGWISTQIEAQEGLGSASRTETPQSNLGTFTNPSGAWSSRQGFRIPELAWQQSLDHGRFVALAGVVSQGNYLDANTYANSARGQFLNSALINSMVLPLPDYNLGASLQYQPQDSWFVQVGGSVGNTPAGAAPWVDFSRETWSAVGELGFTTQNVAGLGPGAYRIQPFIASAGGPTQGGLAFNLQQRLGEQVPVGWFGRFGVGGSAVTQASAQIGTGFVVQAPLRHLGLIRSQPNDGFGVGVVWSRPSPQGDGLTPSDETVLELGYVLQLTPMLRVQPDLQIVWNPAQNPDTDRALVVQLQLDASW